MRTHGRLFFQGGERYTPVNEERSQTEHDIFFDETKAYSKRFIFRQVSSADSSYPVLYYAKRYLLPYISI